ncbi:MAG: NAD-dependent epimerase/dehydratase family protein [Bryobacteraceae bacterium]|jgi:nucleoside-diphosphate-sugar epimerase
MILVTGGTGFIGSHLVDRLISRGSTVRCLVRRTSPVRAWPPPVERTEGDLETGAGLAEALRGVDTVIHLAGVTKARVPSDYERGNVTATANLIRAAEDVRRFVHVSSLAAAGPSPPDRALTEADAPRPVSRYGRSKLAGEEVVRKSPLSDRTVIVRPPVVYGPRDADVFQMIRAVASGWMLQIGRTPRRFSLIYVGDLVDGIIAAADGGQGGQLFYLAHAAAVSWAEFGGTAAGLMGRRLRTLAIPEKAAYAVGWCAERWSGFRGKPGILSRDKVREACCTGWVCDPGLAGRELDFRARTGLQDGLRQTVQWYEEAGWLKL